MHKASLDRLHKACTNRAQSFATSAGLAGQKPRVSATCAHRPQLKAAHKACTKPAQSVFGNGGFLLFFVHKAAQSLTPTTAPKGADSRAGAGGPVGLRPALTVAFGGLS